MLMMIVFVEVLWRVSSLCHWLPLTPSPVPAAGMMNVAALAAIGRIAIDAAVNRFLNFMKAPCWISRPARAGSRCPCEYELVHTSVYGIFLTGPGSFPMAGP